jgi:hypothetical protein
VAEKKALTKIVIKCASMEGNFYDGFAMACTLLKFRDPGMLMKKMPETIQEKIRSAAILKDEKHLILPVDYQKEVGAIYYKERKLKNL